MTEKIQKLRICYNELFGDSFINSCFVELVGDTYTHNCFIEVADNEHSITLLANRDGMLLLINELITLCENNKDHNHYHLDEAGMASKCDKPIIISFVKKD